MARYKFDPNKFSVNDFDEYKIDAVQWREHGDSDKIIPYPKDIAGFPFYWYEKDYIVCPMCGKTRDFHGFLPGGQHQIKSMVCPESWIITDLKGTTTVCRNDGFNETYVIDK